MQRRAKQTHFQAEGPEQGSRGSRPLSLNGPGTAALGLLRTDAWRSINPGDDPLEGLEKKGHVFRPLTPTIQPTTHLEFKNKSECKGNVLKVTLRTSIHGHSLAAQVIRARKHSCE